MSRADNYILALAAGVTLFIAGIMLVLYVLQVGFRDATVAQVPGQAEPTGADRTTVPSREVLAAMGLGPLPPIISPADNPTSDAKVDLGKILFFDPRMSGDGLVSCATCHGPQIGWGDGNTLSLGYPGTLHWRNSQTILNSAYQRQLSWAGESTSLEAQAKSAWTGNLAGNMDPAMAEERLRQIPGYVRRFHEVFGTDAPTFGDALRAIAAFEATITSRNVPFERYMGGDESALSMEARRGLGLFVGKAGCVQCHGGPVFTDQTFHNTGVPANPEFESNPLRQISLRYQHRARGVPESVYRSADRDLGLYYTTKRDTDKGKFRTPSVREVGQTGPYMHNGAFRTLDEVVDFYNRGGGKDTAKDPLLSPLGLTQQEMDDLMEFLLGLTGDPIIVDIPSLPEYEVLP
jgi:cytochrome c peroxidase